MKHVRAAPLLSLLSFLSLVLPGTALAHAHYDHSMPAIGAVLPLPPARVDIYTDSEMRKVSGANQISVTAQAGGRVDDGNTVVDDTDRKHFSTGLKPGLAPGRYLVTFQTLSDADGDMDSGRFSFYVGAGPTAEQKALDAQLGAASAQPESGATGRSRWMLLGLTLLVSIAIGFIVLFSVRRRRAHRRGMP